jgi:hypothetical protein
VILILKQTKNMIEVFKTKINNKRLAARVLKILSTRLPGCCFNFGLEDRDCILRAETCSGPVPVMTIISIVQEFDAGICILED